MTENEQRHFEVLLEDIKHSVDTVAEGHSGLVDRMDRLDAKLDRRADELDEKIGWVAEELKETRDELKGEIQGVRGELKETREEMAAGFKDLGDKACLCVDARRQVEGHEERISTLERKAA